MKKTYTTITVLVVLVLGFLFIDGKSSKLEAPVVDNTEKVVSTVVPTTNTRNTISGIKEFTITGSNFSFTPNSIVVKKGDKVKINFKNADGFHDLIIDEFKVATKTIKSGEEESIEFTADKVGSFQYYCSVGTHRTMGMWGTLKVE